MLLEFSNKIINSNCIKYFGKVDDPDVESEIQRIDKQIESITPSVWERIVFTNTIIQSWIDALIEEKESLIQQFHIDVFFVDGSELRESYPTQLERDVRFEELTKQLK
jgi:hypothetical protein